MIWLFSGRAENKFSIGCSDSVHMRLNPTLPPHSEPSYFSLSGPYCGKNELLLP